MSWLWTRAPSRQWTLGDLDGPPLSSSGAGRRSTRCARHLTSARLTSHSPSPSSFTPASGAPRPERTEACRRGGRCSFIGDALISPGSSTLRAYPGGSPRPRPPPPGISACCGLNRPRRRRGAAWRQIAGRSLHGRPSQCQLSPLSWPRAVACSRGLTPARVALALSNAAGVGRAVRDRSLQPARVGPVGRCHVKKLAYYC